MLQNKYLQTPKLGTRHSCDSSPYTLLLNFLSDSHCSRIFSYFNLFMSAHSYNIVFLSRPSRIFSPVKLFENILPIHAYRFLVLECPPVLFQKVPPIHTVLEFSIYYIFYILYIVQPILDHSQTFTLFQSLIPFTLF